jgi:hypothetical protein
MFGGVAVRDGDDFDGKRARIQQRLRTLEGVAHFYFLVTDRVRMLPVYRAGQTEVLQWGAARRPGQRLPLATRVKAADVSAGRCCGVEAEEVVIRANRALDNDVWFDVRVGVRAVLLHDAETLVVYPLVEPASHYYRNMTGSDWMPCLVRQRI